MIYPACMCKPDILVQITNADGRVVFKLSERNAWTLLHLTGSNTGDCLLEVTSTPEDIVRVGVDVLHLRAVNDITKCQNICYQCNDGHNDIGVVIEYRMSHEYAVLLEGRKT